MGRYEDVIVGGGGCSLNTLAISAGEEGEVCYWDIVHRAEPGAP